MGRKEHGFLVHRTSVSVKMLRKKKIIFKKICLNIFDAKEKWKRVFDETWESQALNDTYKTSVWCFCLEKLI